MSFLPILKFKELKKILKKFGYFPVRQKGSHVIFENANGKNILSVPNHPRKTIGKGLLKQYIRDMDLTVDEFLKEVK
jgi:predicted RNA binding protein YcfA (HicA-like mRNA interferase family)